jgi:hypothetical protein
LGGGAFILFNGGRPWLENAKQAEIRLTILPKMPQIAHLGTGLSWAEKEHPTVAFAAISAGYG